MTSACSRVKLAFFKKTCIQRESLQDEPLTASFICRNSRDPYVMCNSYMFMKNIRGTIAYFKNALNDFLALVRTLGPPTLFVALSADDLHWPELGMMLENLDYDSVSQKSFWKHAFWSIILCNTLWKKIWCLAKIHYNGWWSTLRQSFRLFLSCWISESWKCTLSHIFLDWRCV